MTGANDAAARARHMKQLILDIRPDAPPGFHNYLPGDNVEAAAALYLAAGGAPGESVFYCWGETGCGRTHLLRAGVARALEGGRSARYYGTTDTLPDSPPEFLAVDDCERLGAGAQVQLFSLINRAREAHTTIVIAGSDAPARLTLRPDLATRLGSGLVFQLQALNEAQRAQAVRERVAASGVKLGEDVLRYLLRHTRRDLPSLLTLVDRLDAWALSQKRLLTLPLVRKWLSGQNDLPDKPGPPSA